MIIPLRRLIEILHIENTILFCTIRSLQVQDQDLWTLIGRNVSFLLNVYINSQKSPSFPFSLSLSNTLIGPNRFQSHIVFPVYLLSPSDLTVYSLYCYLRLQTHTFPVFCLLHTSKIFFFYVPLLVKGSWRSSFRYRQVKSTDWRF